jgi:hypothetical protein
MTVIVAMMELRDRQVEGEKDTAMGTIITIITIMGKAMEREREGRGVRMHTRRCPSLRTEAPRTRDKKLILCFDEYEL